MEINLKITKKHIIIFAVIAVAVVLAIILLSNFGGGGFSKSSEGLKYRFNGEGYVVEGVGTCTDRKIIIPKEYNGYPVTEIYEEAFYECENIESIYMPDSVINIGGEAFYGCINLKSVRFSENLDNIGYRAFVGCLKLEKIEIPKKVTSIQGSAFMYCENLNRIEIPTSVTYFGETIFYSSPNVKIYYDGTLEQWDKIYKKTAPNEWLVSKRKITVHCKNGTAEWSVAD